MSQTMPQPPLVQQQPQPAQMQQHSQPQQQHHAPVVVAHHGTMISEVSGTLKRLDPNMLAALLLTVILNGMFFYVYLEIAKSQHVEFIAALNSCPARGPNTIPAPVPGAFPLFSP